MEITPSEERYVYEDSQAVDEVEELRKFADKLLELEITKGSG